MMIQVPMTLHGAAALRKELKYLKSVKRPQIIEDISTALAHGDLSENAEYHAAKEEQSFTEGRIKDVSDKLARAQIIDPVMIRSEKVVFGATVLLVDLGEGNEITYQIVGVDEADIEQGKISISSPIARAMIGKLPGDSIVVHAPAGDREYEIQEVQYI